MTTISIELSAAKKAELSHKGVNAYAVYFTDKPHWTDLVIDGKPEASPKITVDAPFIGGKIYVLIQSYDPAHPLGDLKEMITAESRIEWNHPGNGLPPGDKHYDAPSGALQQQYSYDSFELALTPVATDQGNLTSVNGFGTPMAIDVFYADNTKASRSYDIKADQIFDYVSKIKPADGSHNTLVVDYTEGPLKGQHRMAASPTAAVAKDSGISGFSSSDWKAYVESFANANAATIQIAGLFNGAPSVQEYAGTKTAYSLWHNAAFFSYQLGWDDKTKSFLLTPKAESEVKGTIRISSEDLQNSIYSTLGNATVLNPDGTAFLEMNTGANNQWGAVLRDLVTGFTAGYYGNVGKSLNPHAADIDLSKEWNWDPTYAFANHLASRGDKNTYDDYAKLFFDSTNSYGSGYSDNLTKAYSVGPLVAVANPDGKDVSEIALTLFAPDEKPAGFEKPVIYNFIDGPYVKPTQFVGDGHNIVLTFTMGRLALKDDAPMSFGVFQGLDHDNKPIFLTTAFPHGENLFQNWNYLPDGQHPGKFVLTPYSPVADQPPGSLLINQLPVSEGVNWYQFTVGDGAAAKTFNMYLKGEKDKHDPSKINILNPAFDGQEGSIAIDGLATVTPPNDTQQFLDTFTINFSTGGMATIDPAWLETVTDPAVIDLMTDATWAKPFAPVLGRSDGKTFTQDYVPYDPPKPTKADPFPYDAPHRTIKHADIAFGWYGADAAAENDVSAFTNKIGALNVAKLVVTGDHAHVPLPVRADLDGNWFTKSGHFDNGTYTATMEEFQPGLKERVNKVSYDQTFTVALDKLGLSSSGGALSLDKGSSATDGNWIKLDVSGSSLPNGTLLLYQTDQNGNLIGRDGQAGDGVTLRDAVIGHIGLVSSDSGQVLVDGDISVYLSVGRQLHFAIQTGDDQIQQLPNVQISGAETLSVAVNGTQGTLRLTATVDNDLSANEWLASSQRDHDRPWMYLSDGETVQVQALGSCNNVNTLHFVRIDVDPASGALSVGGVAYGNSDAFRAAVQANWDDGYASQNGGGTFQSSKTWTVSDGEGFYAPVLVTQAGDVFVVGKANVDGRDHIRSYGENLFGFEDLRADQGSDFDYNDMIVHVSVL